MQRLWVRQANLNEMGEWKMLNRIIVQGRIVKKPEMRVTQSGKSVASFTLAVERDYAAQGQERETDFLDVNAWINKRCITS